MSYSKFYILLLLTFLQLSLAAQSSNDSVFNKTVLHSFYITRVSDNKKALLKETSKPLRLFIFLSPECPMCRKYSPLLKSLYRQFSADVEFYGIVPGKAYSGDDVRKYRDENEIPFSLLIDENKALSNYLQASVTPQVILLNRNYEMIYEGAIDNWLVKLGKQRPKATEDFLSKALFQNLQHEKVSVKRVKNSLIKNRIVTALCSQA